jgi:hypothetical protein
MMMQNNNNYQSVIEEKFLEALRHHLSGLLSKVQEDFCQTNYDKELAALQGDPVYEKFCFASPEYVLIRFMGRMSISIGRRLGEIYDKIPRLLASARFGLPLEEISPKINKLELDIGLNFSRLKQSDLLHTQNTIASYFQHTGNYQGLGIEIRYNFNPNDSARLRKDVDVVSYLKEMQYFPVYLIFSSISPRDEAIARLTRAGWRFLVGDQALNFANSLFNLDLTKVLDRPKVKQELQKQVDYIMSCIVKSHAFLEVTAKYHA